MQYRATRLFDGSFDRLPTQFIRLLGRHSDRAALHWAQGYPSSNVVAPFGQSQVPPQGLGAQDSPMPQAHSGWQRSASGSVGAAGHVAQGLGYQRAPGGQQGPGAAAQEAGAAGLGPPAAAPSQGASGYSQNPSWPAGMQPQPQPAGLSVEQQWTAYYEGAAAWRSIRHGLNMRPRV